MCNQSHAPLQEAHEHKRKAEQFLQGSVTQSPNQGSPMQKVRPSFLKSLDTNGMSMVFFEYEGVMKVMRMIENAAQESELPATVRNPCTHLCG